MTGVRVLSGRWYMGMVDRVDEETNIKQVGVSNK